jgi:hypothetical protein
MVKHSNSQGISVETLPCERFPHHRFFHSFLKAGLCRSARLLRCLGIEEACVAAAAAACAWRSQPLRPAFEKAWEYMVAAAPLAAASAVSVCKLVAMSFAVTVPGLEPLSELRPNR